MKAPSTRRQFMTASAGALALSGAARGDSTPDFDRGGSRPVVPAIATDAEGEYVDLARALARYEEARAPRARAVRIMDRLSEKMGCGHSGLDDAPADPTLQSRMDRIDRDVRRPLTEACKQIWSEVVVPLMWQHGLESVLFRGRLYLEDTHAECTDDDGLCHYNFDASRTLVLTDDGRGRMGITA